MRNPGFRLFGAALAVLALGAGCGKKGAPRAPLNLAPEAPRSVTSRRLGDTVYLQMIVPDKAMNGRGEFSVDHVDVYAVTVAPGTPTPPTRNFIKPAHVIASIPIQPPADPDAPEPETPDPRPRPGETVTFAETVTEAQLTPTPIEPVAADKAAAKETAGRGAKNGRKKQNEPAAAAPAAPPPGPVGPPVLTRFYMLMGVPKKGRGMVPSARVEVPLLQPPGAPSPGISSADETSVTVTWQPPPSSTDEVPGVLYNVYAARADATAPQPAAGQRVAPVPLNPAPLSDTAFTRAGAEPGKEQCFVVRSLAPVGTAVIESDPSRPICITPKDTFPPAAPKGLAAVASTGSINLIWDANGESDLAGYVVLRGEAPGATLQPLTAEPIKETRYTDRSASAGVRYAYQVIAVDRAGNRSAPSNRVEEAAR
ncbi:MAG TPA: hypothetical protein VGI12_00830 [Vicinamibacterales bacterium]